MQVFESSFAALPCALARINNNATIDLEEMENNNTVGINDWFST